MELTTQEQAEMQQVLDDAQALINDVRADIAAGKVRAFVVAAIEDKGETYSVSTHVSGRGVELSTLVVNTLSRACKMMPSAMGIALTTPYGKEAMSHVLAVIAQAVALRKKAK